MINKEFGSDFYYYSADFSNQSHSLFDVNQLSLFFSGRVALYNLLSFGIENYGWKMVGFPSYYCHEVVDFCKTLPIKVQYYDYNPFNITEIDWADDDQNVFINVNYFGISKLETSFIKRSVVIEDATHDLLSLKNQNAHFVFGSLRKQLPLPVGGFIYDPKNTFSQKESSNSFGDEVASQKLLAMQLKLRYLKGELEDKSTFRTLFTEAEKSFESEKTNSALPDSAFDILNKIAVEELIITTRLNIQQAKSLWKANNRIKLLTSSEKAEMGLLLLCETQDIRNNLRRYLIENNIYPAILWPNQKNEKDGYFENRILFVHADFRYSFEDIHYIVNRINKFIAHA